jgi:Resolvase, N terminal domain
LLRAALYVRVSTLDQHLDNQLDDLRKYVAQRGWGEPVEFGDKASGAKDSRPALDTLLKAARRREFDVVIVWRLDRLGRSLKHLLDVLQEAVGAFKVLFVARYFDVAIELGCQATPRPNTPIPRSLRPLTPLPAGLWPQTPAPPLSLLP